MTKKISITWAWQHGRCELLYTQDDMRALLAKHSPLLLWLGERHTLTFFLPSSAPDLVMYIVSSTSAAAVPSCARYSMGIPLWP
jgi:hypothetical protein